VSRRSRFAAPMLGALCVVTALAGVAVPSAASLASPAAAVGPAAAGAGVKGDPQPELEPFSLGPAMSNGTVAIEPDGSMVVAYDIESGNGKTLVCLLARGGGKCSTKTGLSALSGDDTFGTPAVFVTSADHVTVLQETCCDGSPIGGDLIYSSANGGRSFSAPVRVGNLGVDSAALVGDDVVYLGGDDGAGAQVQSVQVAPSVTANGPAVTVQPNEVFDVGITAYRGGVLVASDSPGSSSETTYVEYADSRASPFTSASSFADVGTIPGEQLLGISGRALLTVESAGKRWVRLRLFNGSSFGPPDNVPGTSGGGPGSFAVYQDPSGAVHVFSDRADVAQAYDLLEYTTSNGSSWRGPVDLGGTRQIAEPTFTAGLDSHGTGIVLGTDPAWAYPVLAAQSVTFNLKSSTIWRGGSTTASGVGRPAAAGRLITLQVRGKSGRWFSVATTREKRGGSFSFTIRGRSAGSFRYRAVAGDLAGYLQFGYSNAKPLRVRVPDPSTGSATGVGASAPMRDDGQG
jgi:hypothetical protein